MINQMLVSPADRAAIENTGSSWKSGEAYLTPRQNYGAFFAPAR